MHRIGAICAIGCVMGVQMSNFRRKHEFYEFERIG